MTFQDLWDFTNYEIPKFEILGFMRLQDWWSFRIYLIPGFLRFEEARRFRIHEIPEFIIFYDWYAYDLWHSRMHEF